MHQSKHYIPVVAALLLAVFGEPLRATAAETAGHSHHKAQIHGGSVTMTQEFHFETLFLPDEVREYQCQGCHVLDGEGNQIGPDLTHVGRRLRAPYLLAFLRDPGTIIPGTPMGKIDLWDEEAAAIARFLSER